MSLVLVAALISQLPSLGVQLQQLFRMVVCASLGVAATATVSAYCGAVHLHLRQCSMTILLAEENVRRFVFSHGTPYLNSSPVSCQSVSDSPRLPKSCFAMCVLVLEVMNGPTCSQT